MRTSKHWKRLTAAVVMVSVFMTEQSIIYASGTNGFSDSPITETEQAAEDLYAIEEETSGMLETQPDQDEAGAENEEETAGESAELSEAGADRTATTDELTEPEELCVENRSEIWYPVWPETVSDAENFLFDQDLIGAWDEEYQYEESYGNQLVDSLAGNLYQALRSGWSADEDGKIETIELGELITESADLEGEDYEIFREMYTQAFRNAFDAFWYDVPDAEKLNMEDSRLVISYTGIQQEDETCRWQIHAEWELVRLEEAEEDSEESAGGDVEVPSAEADRYSYLLNAFREVLEYVEESHMDVAHSGEDEPNSEAGISEETYARKFKQLCEFAEIPCVLVKGIIDGQATVWNAVRMEEEQWYIVDVPRALFLVGTGESAEEGAGDPATPRHIPYGDFSNSHNGFFVYPECSPEDYSGAIRSEEADESTAQPEPEKTIPEVKEELPAEPEVSEEMVPAGAEAAEDELFQAAESVLAETYSLAMIAEEEARAVQATPEKALTPQVTVSAVKAQTYSGKAITPKVTVKDASTKKTLKVGKQYTISYENNVNAGTGVIVIRGIASGGYDGVLRVNFTINPQQITKASSKIVGKGFTYTGQPVMPDVTVAYSKVGLRAGIDYQIAYVNNVAKGKAEIHLTGLGNFTGTKVLKFNIAAKKMNEVSVALSASSAVFTTTGAMPGVTVKYGSLTCQPNVDYTISYPKTLKAGKNTITIKGKGNYTGSVKVVYTLSKASLGDAKVQLPYAWKYTGKNIKVLPSSVIISGVTLQTNKDFTVQYQDANGKKTGTPKKSGDYRIVLTGKGNYQGTLTYNFCITEVPGVLNENYNSPDGPPDRPVPPDTSPGDSVIIDKEKDKYYGYYEGYKIYSKKGIQGVSDYTEDLQVQHVLLNVDMADLISPGVRSGYIPYVYKGRTYYFSDLIALKNTVYYLHGWGAKSENPYGSHSRNVTFVLLMSWKDELSYLIHPSARKKVSAPYYALNMQEAAARDTYEALFRYMGEELGAYYKYRVDNWTLGNEVNSCNAWNYSGGMSLNDCVANYAQAFQLLDKGVRRATASSRLFISLDHCWNKADEGHTGKAFLDQFAAYMNQTAPNVQWNVNYHPYSNPLNQAAFWKNTSSTSTSVNTQYISMQNIQVLTDYLSTLESKYGKASGSIRVIIGELGYTARQGNANEEKLQAAALGYGYYIALFNTRIDSYIVRAYLDDPAETKSGLYLGFRGRDHKEKLSYEVYKYLDTNQSLAYMNQFLSVIGISSWESKIPGFNSGKLAAEDF